MTIPKWLVCEARCGAPRCASGCAWIGEERPFFLPGKKPRAPAPAPGKFAGLSDEELQIISRWGGRDTDRKTYPLYTEIADERRRRAQGAGA